MKTVTLALAAGAALAALSAVVWAQPPAAPPAAAPATPPAPIDYSKPETWLCRPGMTTGACASDQSATEVAPDGSVKPAIFARPANPPLDCFYVYPTASEDQTPNSDMIAGREVTVTTGQFGRYGAVCRQFAPLYRSVTLAALSISRQGGAMAGVDRNLNYNDVKDAWNYYLQHDNGGRPVLIVGHSQGAGLITRLVREEIEGKPVQARIVAVHQLGTTVQVPPGKDVGGTYQSMPLCRRSDQSGCIVVYSSFNAARPPSVTPPSRFARAVPPTVASCTNPAALAGGKAPLDLYQGRGTIMGAKTAVTTPYVRLPGAVTGECVTKGEYTYLEVTETPGPAGGRVVTLGGNVNLPGGGGPDPTWGMHNGDMSIPIGNLVALAQTQYQAWARARR